MELLFLGTGHASVQKLYNTTFILKDDNFLFLVDGGGGSQILDKLNHFNYKFSDITDIFVTHKHLDHITGIFWLLRFYLSSYASGKFTKDVNIYSHQEVINILRSTALQLFSKKEIQFIDTKIHFITVEDGQKLEVQNKEFTFFDIQSNKAKQFGFSLEYERGKNLVCLGDEPYRDCEEEYIKKVDVLMHEAFCLYNDADKYHPYEKFHSTVKEAAMLAEQYNINKLIIYHHEEDTTDLVDKYSNEARQYYSKEVIVPDDLQIIKI